MNQHEDTELSSTIKAQATRHEAPLALGWHITAALKQADPLLTPPPRPPFWWAVLQQRWVGMGVAFACGLIISLTVTLFHAAPREDDRLLQEVVAGHVRSLMVALVQRQTGFFPAGA
jgi:hypothetical protein